MNDLPPLPGEVGYKKTRKTCVLITYPHTHAGGGDSLDFYCQISPGVIKGAQISLLLTLPLTKPVF